jgi:hypothetical protein
MCLSGAARVTGFGTENHARQRLGSGQLRRTRKKKAAPANRSGLECRTPYQRSGVGRYLLNVGSHPNQYSRVGGSQQLRQRLALKNVVIEDDCASVGEGVP